MTDKLKKCPFCGGEAEKNERDAVWCESCIDDMGLVTLTDWQTRAEDKRVEGLVEALEGLVTAVKFKSPPEIFNGVKCWDARVPLDFVNDAEQALKQFKGE